MLRVGALFGGIGGIELGLERTGYFKTEWFVEVDEFCQRVLRKHWPGTPIYGDIRTIKWGKTPKIDMLTGGFPCQDISCANPKAEGITGSRSGLWKEYAKAIRALRPRYALIENVPAIVGRGLNVVLADLAEAGYDAEWFNLRASDVGAPHRRERIFIIAYPRLGVKDARGNAGQGGSVGEEPRREDSERIVANNDEGGLNGEGVLLRRGRSHKDSASNKDGTTANIDSLSRHRVSSREPDDERRIITDDWRERVQGFNEKSLQREQGFSRFKDVRRVEDLRGRPDIPEPLFCGARDGVPDWVDRIKACGNAVVPQCAEFIGGMIMKYEEGLS